MPKRSKPKRVKEINDVKEQLQHDFNVSHLPFSRFNPDRLKLTRSIAHVLPLRQAEFPLLDGTLIAAMLLDVDASSSAAVEQLRTDLALLSPPTDTSGAETSHQSAKSVTHHNRSGSSSIADRLSYMGSGSSCTSHTTGSTSVCASTTTTSDYDGTPFPPISPTSNVAFLHSAFPHLPISELETALKEVIEAQELDDPEECDVEDVVQLLLSKEFIRELGEGYFLCVCSVRAHTY